MTKSYDSVIKPLASKVKTAQYNEQIAAGEATITKGKELDKNIADITKDRENIAKNITEITKDSENIAKIGEIRKDIRKILLEIIDTSSKTEQEKLITTFNSNMTQFIALRAEIQRNDSDRGTIKMLAEIDAGIAIIRSHPKLKPFDKDLMPFTLAAR